MKLLKANWPAPANINAITTTSGGHGKRPYGENNLALHVGDDEKRVLKNRIELIDTLKLPCNPLWLNQTHSNRCIVAGVTQQMVVHADAAISYNKLFPLVVMTADCLPITLCNQQGNEIAIIHAGWRGMVNGIIENTLTKMKSQPEDLMAWIGPAICGTCFETDDEVSKIFIKSYPIAAQSMVAKHHKWFINLPGIAELILHSYGIKAVYQSQICTFELKNDYYSYRRESQTGRMSTLIWFN